MKFILTLMTLLWAPLAWSSEGSPDQMINCGDYLEIVKEVPVCTDLGPATASDNCRKIKKGEPWMDEFQISLAWGTETEYPEEVCYLMTDPAGKYAEGDAKNASEYCCGG